MNKPFHGKALYCPSGAASEYSKYAVNLYIGCMGKNSCKYCYCPKTLRGYWPDVPTLKKSLKNNEYALSQFMEEVNKNIDEVRKYGIFFNFVSDPFLPETFKLNLQCMAWCVIKEVKIKALTKQTWWIDDVLAGKTYFPTLDYISIGFTFTGFDRKEPGASPNMQRVYGAQRLHDAGFKIFGSFEPAIDLYVTYQMILHTKDCCDLFKIGLQSGKKYDKKELLKFMDEVQQAIPDKPIYWKDSVLKQAGINRSDLPSNCVTREFNL